MTHEELDRLWFQAMEESIKDGEMVARYHFAALVTAAQREARAKVCDHMASRCNDIRTAALEVAAENIRARSNT